MTLDEAIADAEEAAEYYGKLAEKTRFPGTAPDEKLAKLAANRRQVAAWLRELKRDRTGLGTIKRHASWKGVLCSMHIDHPGHPGSNVRKCLEYVGELAGKLLEKGRG